jgi:hypothetical protein
VLGSLGALLAGRRVVATSGGVCGLAGGLVGRLLVIVRRGRRQAERFLSLGQKDREQGEDF